MDVQMMKEFGKLIKKHNPELFVERNVTEVLFPQYEDPFVDALQEPIKVYSMFR